MANKARLGAAAGSGLLGGPADTADRQGGGGGTSVGDPPTKDKKSAARGEDYLRKSSGDGGGGDNDDNDRSQPRDSLLFGGMLFVVHGTGLSDEEETYASDLIERYGVMQRIRPAIGGLGARDESGQDTTSRRVVNAMANPESKASVVLCAPSC